MKTRLLVPLALLALLLTGCLRNQYLVELALEGSITKEL